MGGPVRKGDIQQVVLKEGLAGGRTSGKTVRRGKVTSDMEKSIGKSMEVGK